MLLLLQCNIDASGDRPGVQYLWDGPPSVQSTYPGDGPPPTQMQCPSRTYSSSFTGEGISTEPCHAVRCEWKKQNTTEAFYKAISCASVILFCRLLQSLIHSVHIPCQLHNYSSVCSHFLDTDAHFARSAQHCIGLTRESQKDVKRRHAASDFSTAYFCKL